ncbi:YbjQ family protein [Candidatus Woesearchaeota archaeon]|nr:YbjQ family protein [Candidatus Woesearchaeota archaeon]
MIIANTDYVAGKKIKETLGIVRGSTVRAKHIGKDVMAMLKQIVGGEITGYTQMINEARDEAVKRMVEEAKKLKADAIVNVRFATSDIMQGAAEVMAYGTAVRLK